MPALREQVHAVCGDEANGSDSVDGESRYAASFDAALEAATAQELVDDEAQAWRGEAFGW